QRDVPAEAGAVDGDLARIGDAFAGEPARAVDDVAHGALDRVEVIERAVVGAVAFGASVVDFQYSVAERGEELRLWVPAPAVAGARAAVDHQQRLAWARCL